MKWSVAVVMAALGAAAWFGMPAQAMTSVKIQPLLYHDALGAGEKKSGFVDVSNPNDATTTYRFSVQAFRQIADDGTLQFRDDEQIASGIHLDVTEAQLAPKDVLRLYFVLDGAKLPTGDVFAAIMATSVPTSGTGTAVSVRAGTLFVLSNGTPASHVAEITELTASRFQFGDGMRMQLRIHNPAPESQATGFFPTIHVSAWPFIDKDVEGPLVFAGRTRTVTVKYPGNYAGIVRLRVGAGANEQSTMVVVVTGWFRWAIPLTVVVIGGVMYKILRKRRRRTER